MAELEIVTRDIRDLELTAKAVGGLAGRHISPAVRKAMKPVLQAAKSNAPVATGALKKGLVLRSEKSGVKLKKVFVVGLDSKKNDIFAKESIGPDGKKKRYYYPASQEFGFKKSNGGKVPGKHYLKRALDDNEDKVADDIIDGTIEQIRKEWVKKHSG